jgi:hypothetical protein
MQKKNPKTLNQTETKKLSELIYVFIGVFKVKKKDLHLTLLIIWNLLT